MEVYGDIYEANGKVIILVLEAVLEVRGGAQVISGSKGREREKDALTQ